MHLIPFYRPDISETEITEITDTLRSGWITTGRKVKLFEKKLHNIVFPEADQKGGLICLNCATAAEEMNLRVFGISPGDEVIVPAYTYTATASAVIHCGATVRFVDIQENPITHAPEMDYTALHAAINERTKAVIPVDYGGVLCDYETINAVVCDRKDVFRPVEDDGTTFRHLNHILQSSLGRVAIVSDSAHAFGSVRKQKGRWRSSAELADFTSYSFHAVKNLTTAEGGASAWRHIIDDHELYRFYQLLSNHGQSKGAGEKKGGNWEYDIIGPWYKYNMTDVAASIGLGQLERYPDMLERRRAIVRRYDEMCDRQGLFHLNHMGSDYISNCHLYPVRIPGIDEEERNELIRKLAQMGVQTNVHYKPLPIMTAYKNTQESYPNSYDYYRNLITLPLYSLLTDDEVTYICECVRAVL